MLLDPNGPVQQSRLARLVITQLGGATGEDTSALSVDTWVEMELDPRGADIANKALIMALVGALALEWGRNGAHEAVAFLRSQLAGLEVEDTNA